MVVNSVSEARIEKLDAIRFVAAAFVAISHGAMPVKGLFSDPALQFIAGAVTSTFNGEAAVMVFFIVSGLCIHFPNVHSNSLPVGEFLIRRYIRIGVPLVAIQLIAHAIGTIDAIWAVNAVLWSLYAELVYYTLYPAMFRLARITGWSAILIVSGFASLALAVYGLDYSLVQQFGWLAWLWGLPIWISGCTLAERLRNNTRPTFGGSLVVWRLAVWGAGAAAVFALYHLPVKIGSSLSLLPFSVLAYFWLEKELHDRAPAPDVLTKFGTASFSLYLVHGLAIKEAGGMLASLGPITLLGLRLALIAAGAYAFYRIIEYPSHRLARRAAQGWAAPARLEGAK